MRQDIIAASGDEFGLLAGCSLSKERSQRDPSEIKIKRDLLSHVRSFVRAGLRVASEQICGRKDSGSSRHVSADVPYKFWQADLLFPFMPYGIQPGRESNHALRSMTSEFQQKLCQTKTSLVQYKISAKTNTR